MSLKAFFLYLTKSDQISLTESTVSDKKTYIYNYQREHEKNEI